MSGRESTWKRKLRLALVAALAVGVAPMGLADSAGAGQSYIPGRVGVRGTVPNPGTQQQELTNITFPAPYNVFEFTVTCAGCHGGSIDQQVGQFGVQSGTAMASSARDPVFRANQIAANNILRAVTGADGAGNMCFRCHSPNGWYSGRFDPTLGGDAEGRTMEHSIVLSTDDEGISCEQCHRAIGQVQYKRTDLDPNAKAWNLMKGIGGRTGDPGWPHDGKGYVDQAGTPTVHPNAPLGDTSLQYADGMTYNGPYSGTVFPYFGDSPWLTWGATDYTGQIYAVYPPGHPQEGQPVVNPDGSVAPHYDLPISPPIDFTRSNFTTTPPRIVYDYQAQSMSLEHPTAGNGFLQRSEFCGSCHELTVPVLDHGMPEQRTYTEWKFSAYAQPNASVTLGIPVARERTQAGEVRCQDCHMPKVRHEYADNAPAGPNADPLITGWFPYAKDRNRDGGVSKHTHAGANRDLALMMKVLYPEPDLEVLGVRTGPDVRIFPGMLSTRNPMYDRTLRNTELSMADAVSVDVVSGPVATATPGVYEVQVKVTNRTGHRIPSGYPDGRRMWIGLDVKDATGASVYRSGVYDLADARLYTDATGKTFTRALKPLVDAAGGANAVMVYERVTCRDGLVPGAPLGDGPPDGICEDEGTPFILNNRIMFDNRIPPAGFTYADYRTAGVKFWSYERVANPNAGGALRPQPCEDAPGFPVDPTAVPSAFGASCSAATAPRYPDGQGYDLVTYRFASAATPASARAEVHWQTHTREFMTHLRDQQENLGLVDAVRPTGPLDPLAVGYPLTPSYLSDVIGLAAIADPFNPGVPLRDNWGGVAYAAWLKTGRGAPTVVAAADTTVTAPPAAAPANLAAAGTAGVPFEATISWTPVPGAEGYVVSILYGCPLRPLVAGAVDGTRCFDPAIDGTATVDNAVSTVGSTTQWDRLALVKASDCGAGACALVNTAMNVGKTYGFKVAAFNAKGTGPESSAVAFQTAWDIPLPPDLLKLTAVTTTSATLSWTDTADNETIFVVQLVPVQAPQPPLSATLTPAAGGTTVMAPSAPEVVYVTTTATPGLMGFGGNSLTIAGLAPDTAYNVQVQACNANACSGMNTNGPIQIRTGVQLVAPTLAAPTVVASPLTVNLGWTAVTGAADYVVQRSIDAGATWANLGAVASTTYSDTAVANLTTYTYRVLARSTVQSSPPSNTQAITTPSALPAPTGVAATAPTAQRATTVSWTYPAGQGQTGFRITRLDLSTGVSTVLTAAVAATATAYLDTLPALPATQGTAELYAYTVAAVAGTMASDPSARSATIALLPALPAAPTGLTVTGNGAPAGSLSLGWQDRSQNETGFTIERQVQTRQLCTGGTAAQRAWSAATTATILQAGVTGTGTRSYLDGGLTSGCTARYRYRVRSVNDRGASAWAGFSGWTQAP